MNETGAARRDSILGILGRPGAMRRREPARVADVSLDGAEETAPSARLAGDSSRP
jgi:hypothetical protein